MKPPQPNLGLGNAIVGRRLGKHYTREISRHLATPSLAHSTNPLTLCIANLGLEQHYISNHSESSESDNLGLYNLKIINLFHTDVR